MNTVNIKRVNMKEFPGIYQEMKLKNYLKRNQLNISFKINR